jgi:hypothetical protein
MRKLFDFSSCMGDAPEEPGANSSNDAWVQYHDDFDAWYFSCLAKAEIVSYPPPHLPPIDEFEDNKGGVWVRIISSKGVDFKLNFFDNPSKLKSLSVKNKEVMQIVGLRITPKKGYAVLTVDHSGINVQKLNVKKIKLKKLFKAVKEQAKLPVGDLNKSARLKRD